jgi:hypothetical protein
MKIFPLTAEKNVFLHPLVLLDVTGLAKCEGKRGRRAKDGQKITRIKSGTKNLKMHRALGENEFRKTH